MNLNQRNCQFIFGLGMLLLTYLVPLSAVGQQRDSLQVDTTRYQNNNPYKPSFRYRDRYGDPYSTYTPPSPFYLQNPPTLKTEIDIDTGRNYTIQEKMGNVPYRPNNSMSFGEFNRYQTKLQVQDYWQTRTKALDGESAVTSRNLIPRIYISPVLDRIFGGSYVEIIPRGFVTLDFGASFQNIKNPAIPLRQQRNGGFEFDQQISLSVVGKIGEKLAVTTNFDNNNSFDFQNNMKVEYTGFKEDILKKLELGNVSLPLNNSLITGAQNLFGVKAQMQFGKLFVTAIATTQRGKQNSIVVSGSTNGTSQGRPFEIVGSNYDDNRHFFLSQFFRKNFEQWMKSTPQITSGVNIVRVEVYLMNRQNDTQTMRNVVAFMDMGEGEPYSKVLTGYGDIRGSKNAANDLFQQLQGVPRNADNINAELDAKGFVAGLDYEKITSARKLSATEFTFHKELGYITLSRKLQNDEALAVAFEYTYNGTAYKVGELSEDYSNLGEEEVVYLKMLRPKKVNVKDGSGSIIPSWNLMMKNIYNLNVQGLTRDGFQLRVIYRDDRTGIDNPTLQEGSVAKTKQLIEVFGLDRLNPYNDPQPDGNFDFVDKLTVNAETGLIIFPFLEPFNNPLRNLFDQEPLSQRDYLKNKYVYDTLYHTTKAEAELVATKNKFYLVGTFKSGSGKDIIIQGFNITQGSVKVYAGGTPLREGADYTVDYTFGKVTILNEGILSSGKDINITYEQQDPFAFQTRSLLGTRFDYRLSEDINIGSTVLYYNERPLISRNLIGTEPARNLQYGLDLNVKKNSRFLTKMVDALPFIQTKEISTVNLNAEFAQLLPGTSNIVQGEGTSFIDDFENTATPTSLMNRVSWRLSTVPKTPDNRFDPSGGATNDLRAGERRAKLSWYQVDNSVFYLPASSRNLRPSNVSDKDLENHYVRKVGPQEIFPFRDQTLGNFNEQIFDIAYFPSERGPYNYSTKLDAEGRLLNPKENWGGIMTAVRSEVDFDKANVEYIEFWMLDPFIKTERGKVDDGSPNATNNDTGGQLIFHMGDLSEDLIRDGKFGFENGLPANGDLSTGVTETPWGYVTTQQYLNDAFANDPSARPNQDVGMDGARNDVEKEKFATDFLNKLPANLSEVAREKITADPSADDFKHFLAPEYNNEDVKVLGRYKNFSGQENNSPVASGGTAVPQASTTIPDSEDMNADNTLGDGDESYYVYNIDLKPNTLAVGNKFIFDKITPKDEPEATWYLFRIPVRQFDEKVGDINDFKSIKYIRMYMTGFDKPVVLRLANFRSVGNRWRRYTANLEESQLAEPLEPNLDNFAVSVVNVEENGQPNATKPGYVPPLTRDRDITSVQQRRLNEQAIQLCVSDLPAGDARAIYKNVTMDFFNYGRIKMFFSIHTPAAQVIADDELKGFLRLGTDFDENYYEIEVPLKMTPPGVADLESVWPEVNEIDLDLNELYALKSARDRIINQAKENSTASSASLTELYPRDSEPRIVGRHKIRIMGRPDLSQVKLMMIGVRNPKSNTKTRNVCLWANELRLTDFDRTAGWAGNMVLSTKLADLGTVTGSIRHITYGYGGVQSKIYERSRAITTSYDISANIQLDKLLPKKAGLSIPVFASYESKIINPNYDPANPDMRLEAALLSFTTEEEKSNYKKLIQDRSVRRSLNFTNVRKVKTNKESPVHVYDLENFSFTYAFSEATQTNFNLQENTKRNVKGGVAWQYTPTFKGFEPFKNAKGMKSPYLQLIKDLNFNPWPTNVTIRAELDRSFSKIVYRNAPGETQLMLPNFQKYFVFNRFYNARWNLTKLLTLDYGARVNAIIDEPDGDINTKEKKDSLVHNLKSFGRMKAFDQTVTANYTVPFEKIPLTNWMGAEYRYNVGYSWKAGPLPIGSLDDVNLNMGNIIQNTREQAVNGRVDLTKLYNKVKFLKDINTPKRPMTPLEKAKAAKAQPDTVRRPPELKGIKTLLRLAMSVRNITGTYTITEGTLLPGFTETPYLFGMDKNWSQPGWGFVLGGQNVDPAKYKDYLTRSTQLTTPFTQQQTQDLSLRANVEPANDLKVQLDVKRNSNTSFQEIYRWVDTYFDDKLNAEVAVNDFMALSPTRMGSYRVSINSIKTSFANNNSINSTVFQKFATNIPIVQERFEALNLTGYNSQSQDVLIPAFIAAYTGSSASTQALTPFPQMPIPNWRVDYNGLNKIGKLKDVFQSVTLSHAYSSTYQVTNFTNSLQYDNVANIPLKDYNTGSNYSNIVDAATGNVVPIYVISQVMISETFAPLIGVNVRTKNKLTARFELKTKRDVSLNISNAQITELNNKDYVVEVGYTKNNLRLPFKDQGRIITLKNDVTFKLNLSINNSQTIQRKLDEVNVVTNGNINIQIRPNISYVVNQKLNIQLYFDRNINEPLVSNSFPRATTKFGTKILFNLAQ